MNSQNNFYLESIRGFDALSYQFSHSKDIFLCTKMYSSFPSQMKRIISDGKEVGMVYDWKLGESVAFSLNVNPSFSIELLERLFMRITADLEERYHCHKILCQPAFPEIGRILSEHLYYPKGKLFQKIVDPIRYQMEDLVFDENGMIIYQGKIDHVPFGFFSTASRGCGWISAYNLLRLNHKEIPMSQIIQSLSQYDITGKIFGQSYALLYLWLRQYLPVRLEVETAIDIAKKMRNSQSGILLYIHKKGSHYATYEKVDEEHFRFYNAVYGAKNHIVTMDTFVKRYVFVPILFLITVRE